MNWKQSNSEKLMRAVGERMCEFLDEEFSISVQSIDYEFREVKRLRLNYLTSLISVEGSIKVLFAFSFNEGIIQKMVDVYTNELDTSDHSKKEYEEETAADVINVVLGNSLSSFSISGKVIDLSPPFVISEAKTIYRHSDAIFFTATVTTSVGEVHLHCIGPKELFDHELNYIKELG